VHSAACRKEKTTVKKSNKHTSHQIECVVYCSVCVLEEIRGLTTRGKGMSYTKERRELELGQKP
jgi:hypothetical protein